MQRKNMLLLRHKLHQGQTRHNISNPKHHFYQSRTLNTQIRTGQAGVGVVNMAGVFSPYPPPAAFISDLC